MIARFKKGVAITGAAIIVLFFCAYNGDWEETDSAVLKPFENSKIVLLGGNLGSRMLYYDHFEAEMHLRYPDSSLQFRNMCDPGTTPGFRPNAGRMSPWAFPGAEKFQTELANNSDTKGHFESEDQWLSRLGADIILTFFGYSESFAGKEGVEIIKLNWTLLLSIH